MSTDGLLAQYMSINSQLSYVELQCTRWNNLATAMSEKLSQQEGYEEKYESSMAKAEDSWYDDGKNLVLKDDTYLESNTDVNNNHAKRVQNGHPQDIDAFKSQYAKSAVPKFNQSLLDEYTELDMEYSTMVAMYDTLKEELQAQKDGIKDQLSSDAQDTHMLS